MRSAFNLIGGIGQTVRIRFPAPAQAQLLVPAFLFRPFRPRRISFRRRAGDNDRVFAARFVLTENGQKLAELSAINPLEKLRQVVRNSGVAIAEDLQRIAQEPG